MVNREVGQVVTWHADNMCFEVKLINKLLISIWHRESARQKLYAKISTRQQTFAGSV